ncbi:MAG: adenylate/guanylate cyclase domain-containing protein [Actinomycetota bacterium]|nr:adenylate/guanylate cyclase domain-containing protein [Actinomycetota bacterium]
MREEALERATADGRLTTLAVELALGGAGKHTLTQVAADAGLETQFVRELMQALGRPNPGRGERVYTDEDALLVQHVRGFVDAGLPRREVLEIARVLSIGLARTADAIRRAAGNALLKPGDTEAAVSLRYAQAADELAPLMPSVLAFQLRAHLRDGIRRELVTEEERRSGSLIDEQEVAIAFADLVDYTRLGDQLPAEDLGRIAGHFNELVSGAIRRPVKLIKTIGDAAMLMSPDVPELIASLLALMRAVESEGPEFPGLRVGVDFGRATTRGGDWFGANVNVASRVTGLAKPGRLLATEAVRELAPDENWKRRRRRSLKGIEGRVRLFSLERATET